MLALLLMWFLYDTLGFYFNIFIPICTDTNLSMKKNRKVPLFLVIAALTSIIVYILFVYVIGMPLPTGILSF